MKGKSKSLRLQKRTYCVYKHRNCFKICSLTDYTGKVAVYTAPCASNSPDNGDGNLLIDQLLLEMDLKCHPCFGQLLRPENKKFVVLFFVDRGYMKVSNRYPISLSDYFYNQAIQNPNPNPNSRVFSVIGPGEDILGPDLRPIPNPVPGAGRSKLTAEEANSNRNLTGFRWTSEASFAGLKNYQFMNERVVDSSYFDPIGDHVEDENHKHIPKIEILVNAAFSLHNRNHAGFERNWQH